MQQQKNMRVCQELAAAENQINGLYAQNQVYSSQISELEHFVNEKQNQINFIQEKHKKQI